MKGGDFPHLLIYGPSGAGKKTRVHSLLKEVFGATVDKQRIEHQVIVTPSRRKVEIRTVASNVHIEVNPSDVGNDDRVVIQELIKAHASTTALQMDARINLKVVVVTEADKLTREAQQSLRRTMEKFMSSCRLILVAEQCSRLLPAIKSRTLQLRVPAPSVEEIGTLVCDVADKEGQEISEDMGRRIAVAAGRNVRRALLMAESMCMSKAAAPVLPHWQSFLKKLAKKVVDKPTPAGVDEIRADLFQLMALMLPTELIFEHLVRELMPLVSSDRARVALIDLASAYEYRSRISNKAIIHIEAFIAQLMLACKAA